MHRAADDVLVCDGFASPEECEELLAELEHAFWRPSRTYQRQTDESYTSVVAGNRSSETAHQHVFPDELVLLLTQIERRLVELFGVDVADLEWWQGTRYPVGGKFDYHLDSGYWDDHYAGDRVATFLLYLTTPLEGGGTHFRALDVLVQAEAGRLVAWKNLFPDGSPNHSMIHAGTPVLAGDKVTLVTWQRQRPFRPTAGEVEGGM
jgi:prolyl 4-hydroxylase